VQELLVGAVSIDKRCSTGYKSGAGISEIRYTKYKSLLHFKKVIVVTSAKDVMFL